MNPADPSTLPLRDVHVPPPVPWWPLAPGWYGLAAVVVLAVLAGWWVWRRRRQGRMARAALAELEAIEARFKADGEGHRCARGLSRLARQLALIGHDPRAVAATGDEWLAVLDEMAETPLPETLRPVLREAPYSPAAAAALPAERYTAAARHLAGVIHHVGRRQRRA
ncbi:MAG: DUF4381 family protein [Gammaproteobacteria bacterium]